MVENKGKKKERQEATLKHGHKIAQKERIYSFFHSRKSKRIQKPAM